MKARTLAKQSEVGESVINVMEKVQEALAVTSYRVTEPGRGVIAPLSSGYR